MKYQAQVNWGEGWRPVGSQHTHKVFVQENIDGPGGYREQAVQNLGMDRALIDFRIIEVEPS